LTCIYFRPHDRREVLRGNRTRDGEVVARERFSDAFTLRNGVWKALPARETVAAAL
jgi:hypothetical protein